MDGMWVFLGAKELKAGATLVMLSRCKYWKRLTIADFDLSRLTNMASSEQECKAYRARRSHQADISNANTALIEELLDTGDSEVFYNILRARQYIDDRNDLIATWTQLKTAADEDIQGNCLNIYLYFNIHLYRSGGKNDCACAKAVQRSTGNSCM